jgi:lysophospholipase L1-like esterase
MKKTILLLLLISAIKVSAQDWPNLKRYQPANKKVLDSTQVVNAVYMGDSITDFWIMQQPDFFAQNGYIDRGISGQTSPQMLLRFRQDVIALKPKVVVLLCGTNDIAGNTGPSTLEMVEDNIQSMTELAQANHIKMVLCSVLPAIKFGWRPEVQPVDSIIALNTWIKAYAKKKHLAYIDYYSSLVDDQKGFKKDYAVDGVHPNKKGYAVMDTLAKAGLGKL